MGATGSSTLTINDGGTVAANARKSGGTMGAAQQQWLASYGLDTVGGAKPAGLAPDFTDSLIQAAAAGGATRARMGRGRGSFFMGNTGPDLSAWSSPLPTASASAYGTK